MFSRFHRLIRNYILWLIPDLEYYKSFKSNVKVGKNVKFYSPVRLINVSVGDFSYIGMYAHMKDVEIGKFCSIGPNSFIGWGIHPTNGISTSPMFYSTLKQNGITLSNSNKIEEEKKIVIGNDVFIGMNVTILDGVTIGDGAVVGAGAVVSKDIPPYAIAIGNPIKILRYRFSADIINSLLKIKWWDMPESTFSEVERNFFDVQSFIRKINQE